MTTRIVMPDTLARVRGQMAQHLARYDTHAAADQIRRGIVFASFTIQTATELAERDYAKWIATSRPRDVRDAGIPRLAARRNRTIADIHAVPDRDLVALVHRAEPDRIRYLVDRVHGIGIAKASFALACSGIGITGCIDGRLIRKHIDHVALRAAGYVNGRAPYAIERGTDQGLRLYLTACAALWPDPTGDTAIGQWREWLNDRANEGRTIDHALII